MVSDEEIKKVAEESVGERNVESVEKSCGERNVEPQEESEENE